MGIKNSLIFINECEVGLLFFFKLLHNEKTEKSKTRTLYICKFNTAASKLISLIVYLNSHQSV